MDRTDVVSNSHFPENLRIRALSSHVYWTYGYHLLWSSCSGLLPIFLFLLLIWGILCIFFPWTERKVKSLSRVQLCDPMDCSLPGSSVHGIFQAIVLEWTAISFSRGSSQPRDWTWASCTAGKFFTVWATRKACKQLNLNTWTEYKFRAMSTDVMSPGSLYSSIGIWDGIWVP